jgi:F-type H+-transporting ATPase subunit delta
MKISAQQYARSLYDSVAGKSDKETKAILKNFVAVLGRNRELSKEKEIIASFQKIWDEEHGIVTATLASARELGPAARGTITDYLKDKTGADKINLIEEIDDQLLGGFVLKYNSKVLDGSLKASLDQLKREMAS